MCVLLLSGCSTRFAYNNIDWLIYWYLDDYVELNNEQEKQFDSMLGEWIVWHKKEELPRYQAQLQTLIDDVRNNTITYERLSYHRNTARTHWERARSYVAPDLITLAKKLDQNQVNYLFSALEEKNAEEEKEMLEDAEKSEAKRNAQWIKRNQKNIKRWLGQLSSEQERFIEQFRERFESTGMFWLQYRRDYQQALREVFAKSGRGADFETQLYELIIEPEQYRSAAFNAASDNNLQASSDYFRGLLERSSNKQINKLANEIEDLRDDVVSLQR